MEGSSPGGRRSLLAWLEARVNLTEIVSFLSVFGLLPTELDTRKPLREAVTEALRQPLPSYARWPRVLGILAFILFVFLGVTGMMLAFYYQPTAAAAYGSATLIARDVSFGLLIHQIHRWSATLFLIILGFRVVRFFFSGLYGRGREVIWLLAVATFAFAAFADLTGQLLPWDQAGYWTIVRAREVFHALPLIGPLFAFLVGGRGLDSLVLTRFYVLHIAVYPFALLVLFYLNFASVRRVGMSAVADAPTNRSLRVAMYDMLLIVIFMIGALMTLAIVFPHPFGATADPLTTPPGARPPWYLLAPYALLEALPGFLPGFVRGLFLEAVFLAIVLVPFLDRSGGAGPRRRAFFWVGAGLCLLWVVLTFAGWHMEGMR
jgi:quinol-cytochrome oxidoreductase complex cytochrome b subunit